MKGNFVKLEVVHPDDKRLHKEWYAPTLTLAWVRHKKFEGTELCQMWRSLFTENEDVWVRVRHIK